MRDGRDFWRRSLAQWASQTAAPIARERHVILLPPDDQRALAGGVAGEEWPVPSHQPPATPSVHPALLFINQDRLFAKCMGPGCGGSELVWLEQPMLWCLSCANVDLGGRWRPVSMPSGIYLQLIQRILDERPEHNRTWTWTQTPRQLLDENRANRVPLPEGLALDEPMLDERYPAEWPVGSDQ
jgi:hypothetical protein